METDFEDTNDVMTLMWLRENVVTPFQQGLLLPKTGKEIVKRTNYIKNDLRATDDITIIRSSDIDKTYQTSLKQSS